MIYDESETIISLFLFHFNRTLSVIYSDSNFNFIIFFTALEASQIANRRRSLIPSVSSCNFFHPLLKTIFNYLFLVACNESVKLLQQFLFLSFFLSFFELLFAGNWGQLHSKLRDHFFKLKNRGCIEYSYNCCFQVTNCFFYPCANKIATIRLGI